MFCRRKLGLWATAGGAAWEPAPGVGAGRGGARAARGLGPGRGQGDLVAVWSQEGMGDPIWGDKVGLLGQFLGDRGDCD